MSQYARYSGLSGGGGGGGVNSVTASAPLSSSGGANPNISISLASTSTNGYLSSTDWNIFNNKQPAGSYITALTGDVTAAGPGSVAATIAANAVTNSKLAQMAAHTYKGNNTGALSNPIDVTSTQLTADLNLFSSSLQGLVPASGGGTVNFLRADGTFAAPPTPSAFTRSLLNNTGSTIPAGYAVCSSITTSGEIRLADPSPTPVDTSASSRVIGVTVAPILNGASGLVAISGNAVISGGLTQGAYAYLSTTPGVLTDVAPVTAGYDVIKIGVVDGTNLYIQIENIGLN